MLTCFPPLKVPVLPSPPYLRVDSLHIPSVSPDSSKDLTPYSLSSTALPPALPPPPPPKNAACMLTLALAESAQQVSIQSQTPTLGSPMQLQETSNVQDQLLKFQTLSEEGAAPPNSTSTSMTTASSCLSPSSPTAKLQPAEGTSPVIKASYISFTTPSGTQLDTDVTPPKTPPYKYVRLPCSTSSTSPNRTSPERQQPVTTETPVQSCSSSAAPAPTPSHLLTPTVLQVNIVPVTLDLGSMYILILAV